MSLNDDINTWETKWCSDSEGMNPEMRGELDEIHKAFIKELKKRLVESYWQVNNFKDKTVELIDELAGQALVEEEVKNG